MPAASRYFVAQCSGSWYLVPEAYREAWQKWWGLDDAEPEALKTPWFARQLDPEGLESLTFTDPKIKATRGQEG